MYLSFFLKENPTAFSPLGGLTCPHKKKKQTLYAIFAAGGAYVPTQEKKNIICPPTYIKIGTHILKLERYRED